MRAWRPRTDTVQSGQYLLVGVPLYPTRTPRLGATRTRTSASCLGDSNCVERGYLTVPYLNETATFKDDHRTRPGVCSRLLRPRLVRRHSKPVPGKLTCHLTQLVGSAVGLALFSIPDSLEGEPGKKKQHKTHTRHKRRVWHASLGSIISANLIMVVVVHNLREIKHNDHARSSYMLLAAPRVSCRLSWRDK